MLTGGRKNPRTRLGNAPRQPSGNPRDARSGLRLDEAEPDGQPHQCRDVPTLLGLDEGGLVQ